MYKELIIKYIDYLQPEHIKQYAKDNNIIITNDEVIIIYNYIKNNYLQLLNNEKSIEPLKQLLREDLYLQLYNLYQQKKTKYNI